MTLDRGFVRGIVLQRFYLQWFVRELVNGVLLDGINLNAEFIDSEILPPQFWINVFDFLTSFNGDFGELLPISWELNFTFTPTEKKKMLECAEEEHKHCQGSACSGERREPDKWGLTFCLFTHWSMMKRRIFLLILTSGAEFKGALSRYLAFL